MRLFRSTIMQKPLDYIHKYPKRAKQLLGISYEQFLQLVVQAKFRHEERQAAIEKSKKRVNAPGGGRKPKLCLEEEVCLCLFYLRQLPTFEVLGLHFGISKTEANDTFHYWLEVLRELLPASVLEQVENQFSDYEMVQELLTEFELLVDSTEQPRQRPRGHESQKKFYSGKKKKHTFKNQFIILPTGQDIVDVLVGKAGSTSDITLLREQQKRFAPEQKFKGDKGYIGEPHVATPHKKPKNRELSEMQKQENKVFSSGRIVIEHMIRLVKVFKVAQERFRLHPRIYQRVISTVCGLVRLRIGALILPI
jgi:hypothetical protein